MIDSDPGVLEATRGVFDRSAIVFSRFHITRRIKKLFKEQPILREKALRMVSTDLFLKDFLDLTNYDSSRIDEEAEDP